MSAVLGKQMLDHGPKILDLSYLIETADGDPEFIDEILAEYLIEVSEHIAQLEGLLAQSKIEQLIRSAHTIKGASANVGATRVCETAATLEAQAKKGHVAGGSLLISLLAQELERVRDLLKREGVENLVGYR